MDDIKQLLELVSERLASTASSEVVVGKPLEIGGLTVVPLSRVSIGLGAGGGEGEGEMPDPHGKRRGPAGGKGTGGGSGGGAKVRPIAVAVFTPQGVQILPIPGRKGHLDKILDKIPEVIDMVNKAKGKSDSGACCG
jgi:uncharacterized spore protein YtfJ